MNTAQKISPSEVNKSNWTIPSHLKNEEDDASEIQIIEEEEEVLVDDFDGQCCRTYPFNHSKIQRWQEERKRKEKERKKKEDEEVKPLPLVHTIKTTIASDKPLARSNINISR